MRTLVIAFLAVAGAFVAFFVAIIGVLVLPAVVGGCRLTSVDEAAFVAGNRAILDQLPVYPGSTLRDSSSYPWLADDACFGFLYGENSGLIERYKTEDAYTLPGEGRPIVSAPWRVPDKFGNHRVPAQVPAVLVWYDGELRRSGWQRYSWSGWEVSYRKGVAFVVVSAQLNLGDPYKRDPHHSVGVLHDWGYGEG